MSVAGLKKQFYKASQVRRGRAGRARAWLGGQRTSRADSLWGGGGGKPGPRAEQGHWLCAARRFSKGSGGPARGLRREGLAAKLHDMSSIPGTPGWKASR